MTGRKTQPHVYKVIFSNQGQVYEIYASSVAQSSIFGFIEVEQLRFGERSKIIVDSSEEKLKTEFSGVRRVFIPMHSIVRIDEVEKEGASRISSPEAGTGAVRLLPMPVGSAGPSTKPGK
jgi:hypothetical protein